MMIEGALGSLEATQVWVQPKAATFWGPHKLDIKYGTVFSIFWDLVQENFLVTVHFEFMNMIFSP